jgi:DNA-binding PadR family transcriptional regulator
MYSLNQTSYVILGLLSIESSHSGYDIRKAIQGSVGYFWGESYGQIYPALKRLAAAKLIAPVKSKAAGPKATAPRRRQEYVLTEAGRTELRQWLALPFHNDPPRNEFLLKLFFGHQAAPGVALAHVKDVQARNRHMLETLEKIEATVPKDGPPNPNLPYWMLTLSLGKQLTTAALEWGEKALAAIGTWEASAAGSPQSPTVPPQRTGLHSGKTSISSRTKVRSQRSSTRSERKVSR